MADAWFPDDVDTTPASDKYMNVKKLELGKEARVRVLSPAVSGMERWGRAPGEQKDKPFRVRKGFNFPDGIVWQKEKQGDRAGEDQRASDFVAFAVWDYATSKVKVMQITQRTILKALRDLATAEDWGAPTGYDIGITRKEENGKVAYSVQAKPPKKLAGDIATAWKMLEMGGFSLDKLFSGGDPFPETMETSAPAESDEIPF